MYNPFNFFKTKFDNTKEEHALLKDLPEVMKDKLIRHYSRVSNIDQNCELMTSFYEYIKAYDQNIPIEWVWECKQDTLLDHADIYDKPFDFENDLQVVDFFRKTFTNDCVFDIHSGLVKCKKIVKITNNDPKLVDFNFTSGSLLTPPSNSSISSDFLCNN